MAAARKGAALSLLLGSPDEGETEEGGEGAGSALAQALIDAVKGGDAAEVETAFQDMYDHCASKPMDDTEEEPEDDSEFVE